MIQKLLDWWRLRGRSTVNVLLIEEAQQIKFDTFGVDIAYIYSQALESSWHLIPDLFVEYRKKLYLLVNMRDACPLDPLGILSAEKRSELADLSPIAEAAFWQSMGKVAQESRQNLIAQAIRFGIIVVAIMFALSVLVAIKGALW